MRLLAIFLLLPFISFGQERITSDQFFEMGLSTFKQAERPPMEKIHFPLIDKYEVRTETRDFNLEKQEYTFRVSPSTPKIRKAQKSMYTQLYNAPDFDEQEYYCKLKMSLHLDWLSLYILHKNKSILNELNVVLNDKQSVYEKMAGTYDFDPEKLFKLQTDKSDIEMELHEIQLKEKVLLNKYNIQDKSIDFGEFITIEAIAQYLDSNQLTHTTTDIIDTETEYKKQLLHQEMELEESEKKRIIDFVQVKYNGPHSDLLEERISLGMGFQLSNAGNQKLKIQKLKIKQEELQRKSQRELKEKQSKLTSLESKLHRDIETFFHLQKTIQNERTQLQNISSKITQKEGSSPLLLLDIENRHLSMKIKALDQKKKLLEEYLKYLEAANKMCLSTFTNYLAL